MKLFITVLVILTMAVVGCGGGGGSVPSSSVGVPVVFSVRWGERGRAIDGPGSALSMVLRISGAGVPNGDFVYQLDRDADPKSHTVAYTSTTAATVGPHPVVATFYAGSGGSGAVVGVASGVLSVLPDGTLTGTILTVGTIASVEIPAGQSVGVGVTSPLLFSAKDSGGGLVAVTPGSVVWNVVSGADKLAFVDGQAKGLSVGIAEVTGTVDGKESTPMQVTVSEPVVRVTIAPDAPVVAPGASKQFNATVTGTSNTAVTWSVLTSGGGNIGEAGLYTAPTTPMYVTVEARSVADPTKAATTQITVQSANLTVDVKPRTVSMAPSGTQQFNATVGGSPNQAVTWSVVGGGVISATGLYQAPTSEGVFTVRATSKADVSASAAATVKVAVSKIAFYCDDGGIYTIYPDGTHRQLLTAVGPAGSFCSPAWSPDGGKIAYRMKPSTGRLSLWTMKADGSGKAKFTSNSLLIADEPAFSSDGFRLFFFGTDGVGGRIWVSDLAHFDPVALTPADGYDCRTPDASTDGRRVAYMQYVLPPLALGADCIWVMNVDGSGKTQLTTPDDGWAENPKFSPDGSRILYWVNARGFGGGDQVYVMDSDGGNKVRLSTEGNNRYPSWSPDGSKIVYSHCDSLASHFQLWVMNADGSGKTPISNAPNGSERGPVWRPR